MTQSDVAHAPLRLLRKPRPVKATVDSHAIEPVARRLIDAIQVFVFSDEDAIRHLAHTADRLLAGHMPAAAPAGQRLLTGVAAMQRELVQTRRHLSNLHQQTTLQQQHLVAQQDRMAEQRQLLAQARGRIMSRVQQFDSAEVAEVDTFTAEVMELHRAATNTEEDVAQ
jgi:hypothetical protein